MPQSLLITGGCGFVGSNLIAKLRQNYDYKIRVLDNESTGKYRWISEFDVEFVSGDILNRRTVYSALENVDTVVHLAADTRVMDSINNPDLNFQVNVVGTYNILNAMRSRNITRIINASTGGAILGEVHPPVHEQMVPQPLSPYGAAKLACEGYCSAFTGSYGFAATSLRFSNVYGTRSYHKGSVVAQFFKNVLKNEPLTVYGDGSQTRDYVFSEDLAGGIVSAIKAGRAGVYQLGTGIPTSINQLIDAIRRTVGSTHRVDVNFRHFRPGEIRHTYCAIDKAREHLNYTAPTSLEEGLATTWDWFVSAAKS